MRLSIMIKLLPAICILYLLVNSCIKPALSEIEPVIHFKIEAHYIFADTSLSPGTQYKVGIIASSANGENLTNLIVESNGVRVFDKGYNQSDIYEDILLTKNLDETEKLSFIIRNKARKADTLRLVISRLQITYSPILKFNNIILGAQDNLTIGNYFSFQNAQLYTQAEAYINQELIDILYYYDASGDANTLASPGANLSGIISGNDSPQNWAVKRTTRYSREALLINDQEFASAENDSLIISNLFTDGGRKAKQLQNNQYFGVQTNENKYGIIRIVAVNGQTSGDIQISLILQE
jgi:hypothetical protein